MQPELFEILKANLRRFIIPLGIISIGVVLVVIGFVLRIQDAASSPSEGVVFTTGGSLDSIATSSAKLMVDIAGAVEHPGIYEFPAGSRIADVVERAGGLSPSANQDWIARNLNLAGKISDGAKIYIPAENESGSVVLGSSTTGSNSVSTGGININTATSSQLDTLSGVGEVTARKIIDGRPYGSIEELLSRKILNNSTYEKIKDRITTY